MDQDPGEHFPELPEPVLPPGLPRVLVRGNYIPIPSHPSYTASRHSDKPLDIRMSSRNIASPFDKSFPLR